MVNNRIKQLLFVVAGVLLGTTLGMVGSQQTFAATTPSVQYRTHVQDIGWQGFVADGATAGTTGQGKRLEAINIKLANQDASNSGSIQYQTHVQNIGWQGWTQDGGLSGTQGQGLRLEAIRIKLTGNMANLYDVYYRVHAENFGWLNWASNGTDAGTMGFGYRLEAIQIKLVPKGQAAPGLTVNSSYTMAPPTINYQTHVQNIGWQNWVADGTLAGTTGQSLRVEAYQAKLTNMPPTVGGGVIYRAYVQNIGWDSIVSNGSQAGKTGRGLRVEAMALELTGSIKNYYDVYYRTFVQNIGWVSWAKNGQTAGTMGQGLRVEAMQIQLVKKGNAGPANAQNAQTDFINKIAPASQRASAGYGTYPSLQIAQAILESGWGKSTLAVQANNYFGIKGTYNGQYVNMQTQEYNEKGELITVNAAFKKYPSAAESMQDNSSLLRNGVSWNHSIYSGTWREKAANGRAAATGLIPSYATDPNYAVKLQNLIDQYNLMQFD
ncbi:MAG: glucosaminidase domain-containing protein [Lactobacillaceae bacterium]|jgi:uncharacterized protein YjdB|nr:glucosaminidase domain-containing protein [Lactobacillaceae bacterium]